MRPKTRYAKSGEASIAHHVIGEGPIDLVLVYGFVSHIDLLWDDPEVQPMLERLAKFARVIQFDKRGVGLSTRDVAPATLEDRMEDIAAVMDATECDKAVLLGISEGVPASIVFTAAHPDRVEGLVLYGGMARASEDEDYPWAAPKEALLDAATELIAPNWDEPVIAEIMSPSHRDDEEYLDRWRRFAQSAATPEMVIQLYINAMDIDVRHALPAIGVPTLIMHRRGDQAVPVGGARWMAGQIPGAKYVEFEGADHQPWAPGQDEILGEIEEFLTGTRQVIEPERVLATVMFTDIVGSTERASELGDEKWHVLLDRHHELVREVLARHNGLERKTIGDGFLATFDGPARGIRCAVELHAALKEIDVPLRIGLHSGEVELQGDDIAGIGVHIAARVSSKAGTGETIVSRTVKDLVAGSGIEFEDRGTHELKGIPDEWQLYEVT